MVFGKLLINLELTKNEIPSLASFSPLGEKAKIACFARNT